MSDDRVKMNLMGDLKAILLATDGSAHSKGAMHEAFDFARTCNTQLTLLNVIEFNPEYGEHFETIGQGRLDKVKRRVYSHYDEIREQAAIENMELKILIEIGRHPHELILHEAEAGRYDLIIMGRRGSSTLSRLSMGSVTAKVLAHSHCKVLVVPEDTKIEGKNILLATDGSVFSEAAEDEAINMALRCPNLKLFTAISVAQTQDDLPIAYKTLEKVTQKCIERQVPVSTLTSIGEPYRVIVEQAVETSADIIIMGTHGRTGLEKIFIGSVAERVIGLSTCSVLVTKTG